MVSGPSVDRVVSLDEFLKNTQKFSPELIEYLVNGKLPSASNVISDDGKILIAINVSADKEQLIERINKMDILSLVPTPQVEPNSAVIYGWIDKESIFHLIPFRNVTKISFANILDD